MILENFLVRKYSFLLFLLTKKLKITINIFNEFNDMNILITKNLLIKKLFFSHFISQRVKFLLYNLIFYNYTFCSVLRNFFFLLIRKNILYFFPKILILYKKMFLRTINFNFVSLIMKDKASQKDIVKIKNSLYYLFFYKNTIFNFTYDKDILDGIIIDIGIERLDLSILFKLNYIKLILKDRIL